MRFISNNFAHVKCLGCGYRTVINPGYPFTLRCKCYIEASDPVKEEKDYTNGDNRVTLIGVFNNGDVEVSEPYDLSKTWRIPKDTFENEFKEVVKEELTYNGLTAKEMVDQYTVEELKEIAEGLGVPSVSNMLESNLISRILKTSDTKEVVKVIEKPTYNGLTAEEMADQYTVEELKEIAEGLGIPRVSRMLEKKLIKRILEKSEG